MANTAKDLQDINDQIDQLRKQLGKTPDSPFNLADMQKAKEALKGLRTELREMSSDLVYIAESYRDSVRELSKQTSQLTAAKTSLKGISDISRKIVEYRQGESSLSEQQLGKLKQQAKLKYDDLQYAIKSGQLKGQNLLEAKDALKEQQRFFGAVDRTLEINKEINKEIGLLGVGLEGAGKFLEKLGFGGIGSILKDAIEKTKQARLQYKLNKDELVAIAEELDDLNKKTGNLTKEDKARLRELKSIKKSLESHNKELAEEQSKYKNILNALKEQLTLTNLLDASVGKIVEGFFEVNKAGVEFKRLTGQNGRTIAGMNSSLASSVDVLNTMSELTKEMSMNSAAIFSPADLGRLAATKNLLGLSEKQAAALGMRSKVAGVGIEAYQKGIVKATNNYNATNKSVLAHGAVLQEVLNTSDSISLSLGGNPEKITAAATAAMSLGLNLQRVDEIASSLTDFQSSISNELEAELLTGKQLNLEKAREFALSNDLAGLSKELAKNGASAAEFSKMNRLQQDSLAKALGMSREELAKSAQLELLRAGASKEAIEAAGDMTLAQLEQASIQDRIKTSLDKLAQAFSPILEAVVPIAEALASVLLPIGAAIGYMSGAMAPFIKGLVVAYATFKAIKLVQTGMLGVQIAMNAQKMIEANRGLAQIGTNRTIAALEKESFLTRLAGNAQLLIQLVREQGIAGIKTFMKGLDDESLVKKIYFGVLSARDFVMEQGKVGFKAAQVALEATLTSIKQRGLLITLREAGANIAKAAMGAIASLSSIPVVGWALGLAAAGTVAALGYSLLKADDAVSPGYGKRTMLSPEGAIQFNDKDTIVAGTNLEGEGAKKGGEQPRTISQASIDITPVVSELAALRAEMGSILNKILAKEGTVYMDSNKVGRAQVLGSYKSA